MSADLTEDLKQLIDQYLNAHRSRSLATLSRVSGVAYSTLRRFSQGEGNPTAEPVLKIVDATLGSKDKIEFIGRHFPEIARTIQHAKVYEHAVPRDDLKQFYMRDPHNYILNLVINSQGSTVDDIMRLTGERGLGALDELVEHGLLVRDFRTGRITYADENLFGSDCDMALAQIKRSADYFDRTLIGTKAAKLAHLTSLVNLEGLHKIHSVVSDAIVQVCNLKDDPRHAGNIPFFVDLIMNVLDKRPLSESPLGQNGAPYDDDDA